MKIEFDIPGDESVHVIELNGPALPPSTLGVAAGLVAAGRQGGNRRGPAQGGSLTKGFDLGGAEHAVLVEAGLLRLRASCWRSAARAAVEGCYIGSDWARSYTSTDDAVIGSLRNGRVAVMVTGSNARIGGYSGEGNLIVGSSYGVFVEGLTTWRSSATKSACSNLHLRNGVEVSASDNVESVLRAPPTRFCTTWAGVKVDSFSADFRIGTRLRAISRRRAHYSVRIRC